MAINLNVCFHDKHKKKKNDTGFGTENKLDVNNQQLLWASSKLLSRQITNLEVPEICVLEFAVFGYIL